MVHNGVNKQIYVFMDVFVNNYNLPTIEGWCINR